MEENPFRSRGGEELRVEPCAVVIFGVTGDLTHRKLVPALYALGAEGHLPSYFSLIGVARREVSDDAFREALRSSVEKYARIKPFSQASWRELASRASYLRCPFDDRDGYLRLRKMLEDFDRAAETAANRVFYLATAPEYFATIVRNLKAAGLLEPEADGRCRFRVVVEKPFGRDLASARLLNADLQSCLPEDQIYRIDHYLGKETVQNLLIFRFGNGIFEPIWNHTYIRHVEISVCESVGVETRAGYFDTAGMLRDMVQNHVFQLLSLIALEPPVAFEAGAIRDEKVKVLRSVRRLTAADVPASTVRGQYTRGFLNGEMVSGYLEEAGVGKDSPRETYAALRLELDNWRWAGTPFFLRAGKRLPKRVTEISIHFQEVPHKIFEHEETRLPAPDILSFQIQPDEGISLKIVSKLPGTQARMQRVNMDFSYGASFGIEPPEAYERLLLDCMRGDPTLFTRSDEIERSWEILAPILEAWESERGGGCPLQYYPAGSWGPDAADELLRSRTGQIWRRL